MELFLFRPLHYKGPPWYVGALIVFWVFLLVEDDSESGLSGLTAMIDSSIWYS